MAPTESNTTPIKQEGSMEKSTSYSFSTAELPSSVERFDHPPVPTRQTKKTKNRQPSISQLQFQPKPHAEAPSPSSPTLAPVQPPTPAQAEKAESPVSQLDGPAERRKARKKKSSSSKKKKKTKGKKTSDSEDSDSETSTLGLSPEHPPPPPYSSPVQGNGNGNGNGNSKGTDPRTDIGEDQIVGSALSTAVLAAASAGLNQGGGKTTEIREHVARQVMNWPEEELADLMRLLTQKSPSDLEAADSRGSDQNKDLHFWYVSVDNEGRERLVNAKKIHEQSQLLSRNSLTGDGRFSDAGSAHSTERIEDSVAGDGAEQDLAGIEQKAITPPGDAPRHVHGPTVCRVHRRLLCKFKPECCVHRAIENCGCPPPKSCCCLHHMGDCCYCVFDPREDKSEPAEEDLLVAKAEEDSNAVNEDEHSKVNGSERVSAPSPGPPGNGDSSSSPIRSPTKESWSEMVEAELEANMNSSYPVPSVSSTHEANSPEAVQLPPTPESAGHASSAHSSSSGDDEDHAASEASTEHPEGHQQGKLTIITNFHPSHLTLPADDTTHATTSDHVHATTTQTSSTGTVVAAEEPESDYDRLCRNQHTDLHSHLLDVLRTGDFSDLQLLFKSSEQLFPVTTFALHKAVVSRSPVLRDLLAQGAHQVIAVAGNCFMVFPAFRAAIEFLYGQPALQLPAIHDEVSAHFGYSSSSSFDPAATAIANRDGSATSVYSFSPSAAATDYCLAYAASAAFFSQDALAEHAIRLAISLLDMSNLPFFLWFGMFSTRFRVVLDPLAHPHPASSSSGSLAPDAFASHWSPVLASHALDFLAARIAGTGTGPTDEPFTFFPDAYRESIPDRIPTRLRTIPNSACRDPALQGVCFGQHLSVNEQTPGRDSEVVSAALISLPFEMLRGVVRRLRDGGVACRELVRDVLRAREKRRYQALVALRREREGRMRRGGFDAGGNEGDRAGDGYAEIKELGFREFATERVVSVGGGEEDVVEEVPVVGRVWVGFELGEGQFAG